MNIFTYRFDSSIQKYLPPIFGVCAPQKLIPFDNNSKKGWCEFHRKWEVVTIGMDGRNYYSCGIQVPFFLGLNKNWNKNQIEVIVDSSKLTVTLCDRFSWIDVHEDSIYQIHKCNFKIIDALRGNIYHPNGFDMEKIPSWLDERLDIILKSLFKNFYGVELHFDDSNLSERLRYPSCPKFSKIENRVDDVRKFLFRNDLNLFKDFCTVMRIKITKSLRKDFQKDPYLIFLHAMAMNIGFTEPDAIKKFVNDKRMYDIFAGSRGILRFSIVRRSVYADGTFYKIPELGNYKFNLLDALRLWVQNARTNKSENVIVKRLIKFISEGYMNVLKDAAELYDTYARHLPVPLHERILKEGFTNEMHDQLVQLFGRQREDDNLVGGYTSNEPLLANVEIKYENHIKRFEGAFKIYEPDFNFDKQSVEENRLMMKKAAEQAGNLTFKIEGRDDEVELIDDFALSNNYNAEDLSQKLNLPDLENKFKIGQRLVSNFENDKAYFVLPTCTDELYEISTNMRNCVGYLYRDKVLSGHSIIVVLLHRHKFHACIEIKQSQKDFRYHVVQASGPCNNPISVKYRRVIEEWMAKNDLQSSYSINYR